MPANARVFGAELLSRLFEVEKLGLSWIEVTALSVVLARLLVLLVVIDVSDGMATLLLLVVFAADRSVVFDALKRLVPLAAVSFEGLVVLKRNTLSRVLVELVEFVVVAVVVVVVVVFRRGNAAIGVAVALRRTETGIGEVATEGANCSTVLAEELAAADGLDKGLAP